MIKNKKILFGLLIALGILLAFTLLKIENGDNESLYVVSVGRCHKLPEPQNEECINEAKENDGVLISDSQDCGAYFLSQGLEDYHSKELISMCLGLVTNEVEKCDAMDSDFCRIAVATKLNDVEICNEIKKEDSFAEFCKIKVTSGHNFVGFMDGINSYIFVF